MNRAIDHIVYAVPDLDEAINWIEEKAGIRPRRGGKHLTQGTKNALLKLGEGLYLEILAADDTDVSIPKPRWMGIDLIQSPQITRWALKSTALTEDAKLLSEYDARMSRINGGQREMASGDLLTWQMTMPLPEPLVELIPFLVDWQGSDHHPSDLLPSACSLEALIFTHSEPHLIYPTFQKLGLDIEIMFGEQANISARIKTPKGILTLP